MYTKRNDRPVSVDLPDGTKLNRSDLPPKTTLRWVVRYKIIVVKAVKYGLLEFNEACEEYMLSSEELNSWIRNEQKFGIDALKATLVKKYRQP